MEFNPGNKARFDVILARYPVKRSALIPTLHLIQEQEGFLSTPSLEYAASLLELTPAQVHDTASFYTMFRFRPEGRHHIEVHKTGFDSFSTEVDVRPGESTPINVSLPSHDRPNAQ